MCKMGITVVPQVEMTESEAESTKCSTVLGVT